MYLSGVKLNVYWQLGFRDRPVRFRNSIRRLTALIGFWVNRSEYSRLKIRQTSDAKECV
jgi:hypothetical protein